MRRPCRERDAFRPGTPQWRARFQRDQDRFDRIWPWWMALCVILAVITIILVIAGVLPAWLLFV